MYQKGDNIVHKKKYSDKRKTEDRKLLHFITLLPCYSKKYYDCCFRCTLEELLTNSR